MKKITIESTTLDVPDEVAADLQAKYGARRQVLGHKETYWMLTTIGEVTTGKWWNHEVDIARLKFGNVFLTESEAIRERDRRLAIVEVNDWIDENCPFEPDWGNTEQHKGAVYYDDDKQEFEVISFRRYNYGCIIKPLATEADCCRLIAEKGDALKVIWEVK